MTIAGRVGLIWNNFLQERCLRIHAAHVSSRKLDILFLITYRMEKPQLSEPYSFSFELLINITREVLRVLIPRILPKILN